jgi:hypothetical protein
MFTRMIYPIFLFESSSSRYLLLLTSSVENELSRGFKPLGILLSSREIISFGL